MPAVAADRVVGVQNLTLGAAVACSFFDDGYAHIIVVLLDGFRDPAEARFDIVELRHACAQHIFALVLRQPFVFAKVIGIDDFAQRRGVPIFIVEVVVGDDAAHRIGRRQQARGAQFLTDTPKIEVLDRALRQVLAFGNALRFEPTLHQRAGNAALPKLYRERCADGSAADDDDLMPLGHVIRNAGAITAAPAESGRRIPARVAKYWRRSLRIARNRRVATIEPVRPGPCASRLD
jgi:hypothetical protein